VYTAGYARTQSAANRLAAQIAQRRAAVPAPQRVTIHVPELRTHESLPARLLPPAPPLPDRVRKTVDTQRTEAKRPEIATHLPATADVPAAAAASTPFAAPEPPPLIAQVTAPAMNQVAPVPVLPPAAAPSAPAWKDGTYTGWGYSRHGNIEASVVIERGRILSATISQCRTRYSCSVIDPLPPQVAQRQSPEVDYISGATQSADAFYGAVAEALSKAK
jgi:uncharacterized protein with FMN-binding domain